MADFQGPNMSREWNLEIGQAMLKIIREEKTVAAHKVSYTVSNMQRRQVFAHVLGLVLTVQSVENFEPDTRIQNGVDAMEVFFGYAQQYSYKDVVACFEALPGDALGKSDAYQDFIQFYNQVMGVE